MRGPAPTPSPILSARGSWRAQTRVDEPKPEVKAPGCPAWLSTEAKAEWRRQVKQLTALGVISEIDRPLLAAFCEAWAEFVEASKYVEEHGRTFETDKGFVASHPMVAIKNHAVERMKAIGQQFGFSPSARTRLRSNKQEKAPVTKARFFRAG